MTQLPASYVPRHVAIIMDGNGRWAQQRGLSRLQGHQEGAQSVQAVLQACRKAGVKFLTLYAFSTENWVRPRSEVNGLMKLLMQFLKEHEPDLHKHKIRLRAIGRLDDLPRPLQAILRHVMKATESYDAGQLVLCLSYGGRAEIVHAASKIARRVKAGELAVADIDEAEFARNLYAPDVPDPDLMIRTSGEMRLSNFLLWQLSYTELYVTDALWPDFREDQFFKALAEYGRRRRRFGHIR
ncbi:MAG: isoprenyl transferase [Verrucomicrobia bacterium]|nr:isoprenyl transferase [Verrucomicrobiota bacterium]MCG2680226.1 isoprenyl transferase [Kiritimatiellia bacterium]MBU4247681.1 isoprenyl transferase [Verrucomicrobiota bacterium]MBU4289809.1 isoprenyl transferase [Verrucomicrobiota bacterium]MBU4428048.1 isoprenyl transferase [Verrucomicrobiota bacterium]